MSKGTQARTVLAAAMLAWLVSAGGAIAQVTEAHLRIDGLT